MSTFTGSELEFLAGLNRSWWRLYWKEFSRLRRIEAKDPAAQIPAFVPEFAGCEDPACALRRRDGADGASGDAMRQPR